MMTGLPAGRCQDLHHGILLDVKDGAPLYVTERVDRSRERSFVRGGSPTQVNQGVKTDTFTYHPIESVQERVAGARRVRNVLKNAPNISAANLRCYSRRFCINIPIVSPVNAFL